MNTVQDIVKALVAGLHQRHLKACGFSKTGNTWVRAMEWPQVISLQLSSSNTCEKARLTVNLGVSIKALGVASGGLPTEGTLKEVDCEIRSRIGSLRADGQDKWWDVTLQPDANQLADEIFDDIERYGLPWFERLTNYAGIAEECERQQFPLMAAIAYHLGGDACKAEASMARAYARANVHSLPKVKRLARVHGIPIPTVQPGSA